MGLNIENRYQNGLPDLIFNRTVTLVFAILVLLNNVPLVPAPVPRCSPFIIINKLAEWSNLKSDANHYFPVPPCKYFI